MKDEDLKVSIVIPVYNGSDYLSVAIDSALSQTYGNVEVVVINDGSTDGGATERIAKQYGDRVKYFSQPNGGVASALNTALEVMTGDVFTWLSHDDVHHDNKVERNVEFYREIGDPDAIICSYYALIDGNGSKIQEVTFDLDALTRAPVRVLLNGCVNGCTLFIPVHIMRKFGPFDLSKKYTQDYYLWNKILEEHDFYCQPESLVSYRIHANQDTQKKSEAVNAEAEPLWEYMLDRRTSIDRVLMEGSSFRYFEHLRTHLQHSPYKKAIAHASTRSLEVLTQTLVSIVVMWSEKSNLYYFNSILKQSYKNIEIVVALDAEVPLPSFVGVDRRVRVVRLSNSDSESKYDKILRFCSGEYVIFSAGAFFSENRVERQHRFMQMGGLRASMCSLYRNGMFVNAAEICELKSAAVVAAGSAILDTYMFHKLCWYEAFRFFDEAQVSFELQLVALLEDSADIVGMSEPLVTL